MVDRRPVTWYRDHDQLVLAGSLDERAQLVDLVGHARGGRLALDLAGITFCNSSGMREWIRMQQAASSVGIAIELRRVAEILVHQLNIVPAARGASLVSSFYAQYACEECEDDHDMLVDLAKHGVHLARGQAPEFPCPDCGEPMALAHPPELYLSFLTR